MKTSGVTNRVVRLAELQPHPQNYNRHDAGQLADLRKSLRQFGQVRSVVVQAAAAGGYVIVAGHGLVEAARAEGVTELRADVVPADWPAVKVLAYLAADNELARRGDPDEQQLAALVAQVQAADAELAEPARSALRRGERGDAMSDVPRGQAPALAAHRAATSWCRATRW